MIMRHYTPQLKEYLVGYCENLRRKDTTVKAFSKAGARELFKKAHDMTETSIIQIKEKEGRTS